MRREGESLTPKSFPGYAPGSNAEIASIRSKNYRLALFEMRLEVFV